MKKLKNIFLTIVFSSIIIFFLFDLLIGNFDPFDQLDLNVLFGVGNLFLLLVYSVTSFSMFALLFFIPWLIYLRLKKDISIFDKIVEYKNTLLIIVGSITLLSIAGVQLRSLKIFTDEPTEVRVVEDYHVKPKNLEDHFYYYNDSIKDWVLTSRNDYRNKKEKQSHLLLYFCKSETKRYRKNSFGNWLEVSKMGFYAYKSRGFQTLEYIPKPNINYFLFTANEWKKITKEEFFNYRELDSIIRYE